MNHQCSVSTELFWAGTISASWRNPARIKTRKRQRMELLGSRKLRTLTRTWTIISLLLSHLFSRKSKLRLHRGQMKMRVFFYLLVSFEFINQMGICQIFSLFFLLGWFWIWPRKLLTFPSVFSTEWSINLLLLPLFDKFLKYGMWHW